MVSYKIKVHWKVILNSIYCKLYVRNWALGWSGGGAGNDFDGDGTHNENGIIMLLIEIEFMCLLFFVWIVYVNGPFIIM